MRQTARIPRGPVHFIILSSVMFVCFTRAYTIRCHWSCLDIAYDFCCMLSEHCYLFLLLHALSLQSAASCLRYRCRAPLRCTSRASAQALDVTSAFAVPVRSREFWRHLSLSCAVAAAALHIKIGAADMFIEHVDQRTFRSRREREREKREERR